MEDVPVSVVRCSVCGISPLPRDVDYFFGPSPTERCLACQGKEPRLALSIPVNVYVFPKLAGLAPAQLGRHLTAAYRMRLNGESVHRNGHVFIADGCAEAGGRVWQWRKFPDGESTLWEEFRATYRNITIKQADRSRDESLRIGGSSSSSGKASQESQKKMEAGDLHAEKSKRVGANPPNILQEFRFLAF